MQTRLEYCDDRMADIMRAFRRVWLASPVLPSDDFWELLAGEPASRFWVSERRAVRMVRRLLRGDQLEECLPLKRDMFYEIARRADPLIDEGYSVYDAVRRVIYQPAPSFYISGPTLRNMVRRHRSTKKVCREE